MTLLGLVARYLRARWAQAWVNSAVLALAMGMVLAFTSVPQWLNDAVEREAQGVDVVVGAKGSPLQLVLSGVYHLDSPTGNVPWSDLQTLMKNPLVGQWLPLSLGDNLAGFRLVGTLPRAMAWWQAELAHGQLWQAPMQAVLGAEVAQRTGLQVGDAFVGQHGLSGGPGGHAHDDQPFKVVGILKPSGQVVDRLVLTDLASVWQVHEQELAVDEVDRQALLEDREVTLALVRYASPLAAASFPRWVQSQPGFQAGVPAVELGRLWALWGRGGAWVQGLSAVWLAVGAALLWVSLLAAVQDRQTDLALLRWLGASPWKLVGLVVCEAQCLIAAAWSQLVVVGVTLVVILRLQWGLSANVAEALRWLLQHGHWSSWAMGWLASVMLGLWAALWPAYRAYRLPADELLV